MGINASIQGSDVKKGEQLGRGGFADVFRLDINFEVFYKAYFCITFCSDLMSNYDIKG